MTLSFFRARGHGAAAALRADRLAPLPTLRSFRSFPPPLSRGRTDPGCREAYESAGSAADSVCSLSRLRGRVGEGVERTHESCRMPPPRPSPLNGGGGAGTAFPLTAASGPSAASFAGLARAAMLACNDHTTFAVIAHGPHCDHRADPVRGGAGAGAAGGHDRDAYADRVVEKRPSPQPSPRRRGEG